MRHPRAITRLTTLVYDALNPAFQPGGTGDHQYRATARALKARAQLHRTTWQRAAESLVVRGGYDDLLSWLNEKYGIEPEGSGGSRWNDPRHRM